MKRKDNRDAHRPKHASVVFESLEARRLLAVDLVSRQMILPTPRSDVAATAVDGLVLFAGGDTVDSHGVSYSSDVDIYNTAMGTWSTSRLRVARSGIAATTIGDLAVFAGGENAAGDVSAVVVYDAQTGAWTTWQMPKAYTGLAATSAETKVFLAGGTSPSAGSIGGDSEDSPIYDTAAGDWVTAALSTPRDQLAATTVGNLVMFAGGGHLYSVLDSAAMSDSVDIYNTTTDQWSLAHLSQARQGLAATTVGDEAFFAGGSTDTITPSNVVDIYNASSGRWSSTAMPHYRATLTATSVGPYAVFAGPTDSPELSYETTGYSADIYNTVTDTWTTVVLPQGTNTPFSASTGTQAFIGGNGAGQIDLLTLTGDAKAIPSGSVSVLRRGAATVTLTNNGTADIGRGSYVDVYASPSRTFGSSAKLVGGVRLAKDFVVGATATYSIAITGFDGLPAGANHLIATVYSNRQVNAFASTRQVFVIPSAGIVHEAPSNARPITNASDNDTLWQGDQESVIGQLSTGSLFDFE